MGSRRLCRLPISAHVPDLPESRADRAAHPWERNNLVEAALNDPLLVELDTDLCQRLLRWMQTTDDPLLRGRVASPYHAHALAALRGRP